LEKIKLKFLAIMTQRGFDQNDIAQYDDMNGPVLVAIIFGVLLTLKGKLEFGSIYGFGLTGCIGIQILINLMSKPGQYVDLFTCASNLGYSLLPFCFLAATSIFIDLNNGLGSILCMLIIAWSTKTATNLFEYGLDMTDKKYLIAYPIILFYSVFTLITIF
jgi:TRAP-type C4-dicarboxylate transport system permease small subunit